MAATNDDHIKFLWVKHLFTSPSALGRRCPRRRRPVAMGRDFIWIGCALRDPWSMQAHDKLRIKYKAR
jgi:hypothetical protein